MDSRFGPLSFFDPPPPLPTPPLLSKKGTEKGGGESDIVRGKVFLAVVAQGVERGGGGEKSG